MSRYQTWYPDKLSVSCNLGKTQLKYCRHNSGFSSNFHNELPLMSRNLQGRHMATCLDKIWRKNMLFTLRYFVIKICFYHLQYINLQIIHLWFPAKVRCAWILQPFIHLMSVNVRWQQSASICKLAFSVKFQFHEKFLCLPSKIFLQSFGEMTIFNGGPRISRRGANLDLL